MEKLNSKIAGKSLKVNYHDACHLRNSSIPIIEEPRKILNSIDNIELVEMDFNKTKSICCGAGGGVYSIFRENSDYNGKLILSLINESKEPGAYSVKLNSSELSQGIYYYKMSTNNYIKIRRCIFIK